MSIGPRPATDGAIDRYLDVLLDRLDGTGTEVRRILAEVEDHLVQAQASGAADGLSAAEAAEAAIARFGSPSLVARRLSADRGVTWSNAAARQFVIALGLIGVVGLFAIGASGLVAWGMGATIGHTFVAGDAPGVSPTPRGGVRSTGRWPHTPEPVRRRPSPTTTTRPSLTGWRPASSGLSA